MKTRAARNARIAAFTAAALLALFVGQPLHGAAASSESGAATESFAPDPGASAQGGHHAHLCPLCRAANQARFAIAATPNAVVAALARPLLAVAGSSDGSLQSLRPCASGPRAPPTPLSPLV